LGKTKGAAEMDATKKTKPADALLRIPAKASQTHRPFFPAAAMAYAPFLKKGVAGLLAHLSNSVSAWFV